MNIQFRIRGLNANTGLRRWLEQQLERLHGLIPVTAAEMVLEHRRDAAPAFGAQVHLAVPGPDIHATARDHTAQAAWLKVFKNLKQQIERRKTKQAVRAKTNRQIHVCQPLVASGGITRVKRTRHSPPMNLTILLLEHDIRARRSLNRALTRAGYKVLSADNSRQAVHLYLTHDVRLLLVSARQRVLEASVVVKLLTAINGHLPVILIANRAICRDLAQCRSVTTVLERSSRTSAVVLTARRLVPVAGTFTPGRSHRACWPAKTRRLYETHETSRH